MTSDLFSIIAEAVNRPEVDSNQSTRELWTDAYVAEQMLRFHLDPESDAASYRHAVIERAVDWLYRHFSLSGESRYLDLGCGPGLYTLPLARSGVETVGIDFSENSLEYARARASDAQVEIDYRHESYLETDLGGKFDLITMISCDMSALVPAARSRLLERIRGWLPMEGAFVFDFHSTARFEEARERQTVSHSRDAGFYVEGEHLVIESRFVYPDDQVTCDRYTVVQRDGTVKQLDLWHRYYSLEGMTAILGDAGLDVAEVYGGVDGSPLTEGARDITIVAKRAPSDG